jgi:hypothetical protein
MGRGGPRARIGERGGYGRSLRRLGLPPALESLPRRPALRSASAMALLDGAAEPRPPSRPPSRPPPRPSPPRPSRGAPPRRSPPWPEPRRSPSERPRRSPPPEPAPRRSPGPRWSPEPAPRWRSPVVPGDAGGGESGRLVRGREGRAPRGDPPADWLPSAGSSSRIVSEIRLRGMSTESTFTRTTSPDLATERGSETKS